MKTKEQHASYMREWKKRNKEKVNAINRSVKAKKPDLYREINRVSAAKKRAEDPEKHREYRRRYINKNSVILIYRRAKKRAEEQGLAFNLEPSDIVIPEFCPVLGIRLECDIGQRLSHNRTSPALDRHDPIKGYVKGNIAVISNRANHLKNNGTLAEFQAIVAYMEKW